MAHDSASINESFIVSPEISGQDEPHGNINTAWIPKQTAAPSETLFVGILGF
jgi:hypothetical protein